MIEIDGRKWRSTDPAIPEPLRQQLVNELMSARRAVKAAKNATEERAARARVQDAKVALGERGPKWTEPMDDAGYSKRAQATIFALLRQRGPAKTICPSEVARAIGGEKWRARMALVRELASDLVARGALEIRQKGKPVDPRTARGPIRLALPEP